MEENRTYVYGGGGPPEETKGQDFNGGEGGRRGIPKEKNRRTEPEEQKEKNRTTSNEGLEYLTPKISNGEGK